MRFNWSLRESSPQVFNKKTVLSILAFWLLAGCGLSIGEKPWFSKNRVYDWTLPSPSQCETVKYKKTFEDFFTQENGEEAVLLDSMKTAVLCIKRKVVEFKKLIQGAHEDYLTQPELKNLLNHEVVKTKIIEDAIDKITADENFNLFINFKDMILRIHDFSRPEAPVPEKPLQKSLSEAVCSKEPKKTALYKKEVDQLSELLDLMNEWLQSIHVSSKQLALKLNDYVTSDKLTQFFKKNWPEKELDEAVEYLFQDNLHQMDPSLQRKYLSERNAQVIRRHYQIIQPQLNYPPGAISAKQGSEYPSVLSRDEKFGQEAEGKNTSYKAGDQASPPVDFFRYLQEHPKMTLSIPEIQRAALLFAFTDERSGVNLPGFVSYFMEKEREISAAKMKRKMAKWYEKEWWDFDLPEAEKERNEMLDHLYTMTEISKKLVSSPSHITGLDMKYLLLNARLVEMIINIYDFNKNGSVERGELNSVYCLVNSLIPSIPDSPGEKGWFEQWKRDISRSENVFNYILKYQEIPEESSSIEDLDIHFLWTAHNESLTDGEISLSREDLVKLVSVLFREFFPEQYFKSEVSSEQN